jgi:hypothetical protein
MNSKTQTTIDVAAELLTARGVEFQVQTGTDSWGYDWTALIIPNRVRFYSEDTEAHIAANLLDPTRGYTTGTLNASGPRPVIEAFVEFVAERWAA